jgi:hypothetical protein
MSPTSRLEEHVECLAVSEKPLAVITTAALLEVLAADDLGPTSECLYSTADLEGREPWEHAHYRFSGHGLSWSMFLID